MILLPVPQWSLHLYGSRRQGWSYGLLGALRAQLCPGSLSRFSAWPLPVTNPPNSPVGLRTSQVSSGSAQPASVSPVHCGPRDGRETLCVCLPAWGTRSESEAQTSGSG